MTAILPKKEYKKSFWETHHWSCQNTGFARKWCR